MPLSRLGYGVVRPSGAVGEGAELGAPPGATAASALCPATSHAIRVTSATPITNGTNTAEIRSASRCAGALPAWAPPLRGAGRRRGVHRGGGRLHPRPAGAARAAGSAAPLAPALPVTVTAATIALITDIVIAAAR